MGPPLRVLYAEDNPLDADLTLTHFQQKAPDLQLEVLDTGEGCAERLSRAPYDLLLLDNHLPDTDGITFLTQLRQAGHRLPIVMLTVAGDDDSVKRALLAGADDYVTKTGRYLDPLPDLLRALVKRVRDRDASRAPALRERRILYIEPTTNDAQNAIQHLATAAPHLTTRRLTTGAEALAALASDSDVDLVMSDLRLPDMTAVEFLHEALGRGLELPFIVITADGDEETAVALLRLGASDYIVKRDGYLTQLPHAIDNALHRFQLDRTTRRLRSDLEALNRSLEQQVEERTAELRREFAERTRAEAQARDAAERYLRTLENMLEGCQILSPDLRFLFVNEAVIRHGRKTREELIGRLMSEVYPGIERTALFAAVRRCAEERVAVQMENEFAYEDGQCSWFELSIQPVPEGVFILSIDITERKHAEEAMRGSENNLAVTLQSIGDGVIATDAHGRITRMNPAAEQLTGRSLDSALGTPLTEVFRIVSAETRKPVKDPVHRVLQSGEVVGLANHTTLLSHDGREYQVANTAAPIRDPGGEIRGVVLVFKDVTQEYRAQQLIRDREKQLTLITEALPAPISRLSRDGRYLFANGAFARFFGRSLEDVLGRTQVEIMGPQRVTRIQPYIAQALAGERVSYEAAVRNAAGEVVHAIVTLIPDPNGDGGGGHIAVAMDITDRRRAEQRLQEREALFRIAARTARLGGWAIDLPDQVLTWTEEVFGIHELPVGEVPDVATALSFITPEWRETAGSAVYGCAREGTPFDLQIEILSAQGRRRWVRFTGEAERDSGGRISRIHGAIQDIDEPKQSERRISDQLRELQRWQQVMVNRETRAVELKREVNDLLRRLQLPARYGKSEEP